MDNMNTIILIKFSGALICIIDPNLFLIFKGEILMKIFSFFLPQFHSIPENDDWWGKGFTEWTNVKSAKPLYYGHEQPQVPLNDNYYNLLKRETVEWQTKLMHEYHLDGMIYYHYYFKGKMLLEKPAENLLKWKDINQPQWGQLKINITLI